MKKMTPFLLFSGDAQQAIDYYTSVFENTKVLFLKVRDDKSIEYAELLIKNQHLKFSDHIGPKDFDFTPSFSFFVDCESLQELDYLAEKLGQNGLVRMPVDNYGFSQQFTWIDDQFGVSWQLNVA